MEKYKLKKDTFFFEAGTICLLTPKGNLILEDSERTVVLRKHQLESRPELLDEWFEKIEEKKYGGRVPKGGDEYWFITSEGELCRDNIATGYDTICTTDAHRFESGSAFWTREEAEKELKRRKAYVVLKEDTKGFVPGWTNTGYPKKFNVSYSHYRKVFQIDEWLHCQTQPGLFFATEDDAKASIKAHRSEWRAWLGVEE